MNTESLEREAPVNWIKAVEGARRLGIAGRALFAAEVESGRLGIRACRLGKRQMLLVAEADVEAAAQRLAAGSTTP
jgi:hypothetical protein